GLPAEPALDERLHRLPLDGRLWMIGFGMKNAKQKAVQARTAQANPAPCAGTASTFYKQAS
ncbi:MAG: hypothetical protein IKX75_02165, partial [Desulfovibrio sp.]|nr:hypothetical protein [Desulfovibrio sp.]